MDDLSSLATDSDDTEASNSHTLVVGGGFGGIASALRMRARGHKVTLIERLGALGGRAQVFEKGGFGDDLPTVILDAGDVGDGISIVQLFVKSGLSGSGKDAKRLISDGGAKLDDVAVTDAGTMISEDQLRGAIKLSAGKKRHALAKII